MKKSLVVLLGFAALGVVFAAGSWVGWRSAAVTRKAASARTVLHYACPMHPAYHSDRAGDCPSCGMPLEPVYADGGGPGGSANGARQQVPSGSIRISAERQQDIGVQVWGWPNAPVGHPCHPDIRPGGGRRDPRLPHHGGASGWIESALPNSVGSLVRKDEILGTYYAREFVSAQQAYFYALDARDRFLAQNASEAQMTATNTQIQQSTTRSARWA